MRPYSRLFALSGLLLAGAALLAGDGAGLALHIFTLASAWLLLNLMTFSSPRLVRAAALPLGLYSLLLSSLTIMQGLDRLGRPDYWAGERVRLFYPDPNTLGASLCIGVLAFLVLRRRADALLVALPGLLALAYSGSRLALAAFTVGLFLWLALLPLSRSRRFGLVLVCGCVLTGLSGLAQHFALPDGQNLLRLSANFAHPLWRQGAADLQILPDAAAAPVLPYRAERLRGRSPGGNSHQTSLILFQEAGVSQTDVPYLASVYLRSDTPQTVLLSSHLRRVRCEVTLQWSRCVTPVAYGNGATQLQLRLETSSDNPTFDVYVWGAQLETGLNATPLQHKEAGLVNPALLARLDPLAWLAPEEGLSERLVAMQAAWRGFLERPWSGWGVGGFSGRYGVSELAYGELGHAHNLPLQLLVETGILGFLAWGILFGGVLGLGLGAWRVWLSLVLGVVILNSSDLSYYSAGVYYPYWLVLGLTLRGRRQRAGGRAARDHRAGANASGRVVR